MLASLIRLRDNEHWDDALTSPGLLSSRDQLKSFAVGRYRSPELHEQLKEKAEMKRQEQLQKMKKEWKKSKPKITFDEETDGKKK